MRYKTVVTLGQKEEMRNGIRVLVVDDDAAIRQFMKDFLEGDGFFVNTLGDPLAAEEEVVRGKYHILILDLMMPGLSGIDVLAKV